MHNVQVLTIRELGEIKMGTYWNERFLQSGMIWGTEPSPTVFHAIELFKSHHVKRVLIPGAGYGRNSKALSAHFQVTGIELSAEAIQLARQWDTASEYIQGSVLEPVISPQQFDAIYCYDVLHLFLEPERRQLIARCIDDVRVGGMLYFTCFSDEDQHFGMGRELEKGTYEYTSGKYAHFFGEEDLREHFADLHILDMGSRQETLLYQNNQTKEYIIRYILAEKI